MKHERGWGDWFWMNDGPFVWLAWIGVDCEEAPTPWWSYAVLPQ